MRAYIIVTGTIFGLVVIAHIARMIVESHALATDPAYLGITLLAAGLAAWAVRLATKRAPR